MNTSPWYVDVDFKTSVPLVEDVEFDVLDVLSPFAAAMSTSPDRSSGGLSLTMEATHVTEMVSCIHEALDSVRDLLGSIEVIRVDLMTEEVRQARNAAPSIPTLVGYSEIADLAGVSRQRAREIANLDGFPIPVVETASGPLRVKEAVESWLNQWDRRPGRPRKLASA